MGLTCLSVVSPAHVGQDVPVDEVFVASGRLHEAVGTQRGRKRNLRCFCPKENEKVKSCENFTGRSSCRINI